MKRKYSDRFSVKVETVDNSIPKDTSIFSDVFKGINSKIDLVPLHEKEVGILYRVYFEVVDEDKKISKNIQYCGPSVSEARQAFYKRVVQDREKTSEYSYAQKTIAEKLIPPTSDNEPMKVIQLNW